MTVQAFNSGGPPPSSDDDAVRRGRRRRLALLAWLWPDPLQDGALGGRGAVSRIFGWASSGGAEAPSDAPEDEAWRGRRRRLTLLAWLWPTPLHDGALGGRGAGSRTSGWASFLGFGDGSELSEDELWRARRRRLALLLALLAGLAFAPGLMDGQGAFDGGRLSLFRSDGGPGGGGGGVGRASGGVFGPGGVHHFAQNTLRPGGGAPGADHGEKGGGSQGPQGGPDGSGDPGDGLTFLESGGGDGTGGGDPPWFGPGGNLNGGGGILGGGGGPGGGGPGGGGPGGGGPGGGPGGPGGGTGDGPGGPGDPGHPGNPGGGPNPPGGGDGPTIPGGNGPGEPGGPGGGGPGGGDQPIIPIVPDPGGGGGLVHGVPEPATWALMVLGFGFAGYVLRRRRIAAGARV